MKPRSYIGIDPDVHILVKQNARSNRRTYREEVNYALLKFYTYQDNVKTMGKIVRAERGRKGGR